MVVGTRKFSVVALYIVLVQDLFALHFFKLLFLFGFFLVLSFKGLKSSKFIFLLLHLVHGLVLFQEHGHRTLLVCREKLTIVHDFYPDRIVRERLYKTALETQRFNILYLDKSMVALAHIDVFDRPVVHVVHFVLFVGSLFHPVLAQVMIWTHKFGVVALYIVLVQDLFALHFFKLLFSLHFLLFFNSKSLFSSSSNLFLFLIFLCLD